MNLRQLRLLLEQYTGDVVGKRLRHRLVHDKDVGDANDRDG